MTGHAPAAAGSTRLLGLDMARAIALIGMMAVHVVPATRLAAGSSDPVVDPLYLVFGGRSSALFAVLAGVALALVSGRETPLAGRALTYARRSVVARAGVVMVIGLGLGVLGSGVAVILVNYALLFAAALPWLGCRSRTVAWWAAGWLLVTPVVSHVLRQQVPPGPGPVPSWLSLADPGELVTTLLLTGYYPVLTWTGYLLVGLALGRSSLLLRAVTSWRPGLVLAVGGAVLAVVTKAVTALLLDAGGGKAQLEIPSDSPVLGTPIDIALVTSLFGTTPTTSWWWLATSGPHHGTPLDLLHGTGTALMVIGLCLAAAWVAAQVPPAVAVLTPLTAAGSMTLTLYTGHVVALAATRASAPHDVSTWVTHVLVALAAATIWRVGATALRTSGRGPFEAVATMVAEAARPPPPRPDSVKSSS